jgi:RNA-directed DNA polymerase
VAEAKAQRKTRVLDFDLRAYFDNVRHDRLLEKVAQRVDDKDIMHLLKLMLKGSVTRAPHLSPSQPPNTWNSV